MMGGRDRPEGAAKMTVLSWMRSGPPFVGRDESEVVMKRMLLALVCGVAALPLAGCVDDYGGGVASYGGYGPVAYDGFYDDYYGPIYDGYWGDDGAFWYRGGIHDRHFRRGDPTHFAHAAPPGGPGGPGFHAMHGSFTPAHGMAMPHFGGGGPHGGGRGR
jgi:hypothetical protein